MSVCRQIQSNLGSHDFQALVQGYGNPCGAWNLTTQNHMMDPFHSPEQRGQRFQAWLQHIYREAPVLVPRSEKALQYLLDLSETLTAEQAFFFPYLVQELSGTEFPAMSISKIPSKNYHQAHREYRNEWWSLYGRLENAAGTGFLTLHIWRHTTLPPTLWDAERDPKDYSVIKLMSSLVLPGSDEVIYDNSMALPEGWELVRLTDNPFGLTYGKNLINSHNTDTLFPLTWVWSIGRHLWRGVLDNDKPLFMMHSNGCLACSDGIGMKKYTYPSLTGNGTLDGISTSFQGVMEHSWESGVVPEGYPSSTAIRSLIHIEKSLTSLTRSDDWLYIFLHLDNGYQVACYFMPAPVQVNRAFHPQLLAITRPDGTVWMPKAEAVSLNFQLVDHAGYPRNLLLYHADGFRLQLFVASDHSDHSVVGHSGFIHAGGQVTGFWSDETDFVTGFGFVQTTNRQTYQERANSILELFPGSEEFRTWSEQTGNFDNMPKTAELSASYLIWLIPLLFIAVLLIFIVYLVWSRNMVKNQPWLRAGYRSRKHRFFRF